MQEPRVCIAMATYNGEKHMRIQFDSLVNQTYRNFIVVVRDDGSTDHTVDIIKEYVKKYPDHFQLMEDDLGNLRCPGSFYQILRNCPEADYYGFSDQDDAWLPDKIRCAVETLEKGRRKGRLYIGSYDYYTEQGDYIRSFPTQKIPIRLTKVLYHSPASAFTLMFDETIRKKYIADVDPGSELHDRWLIRCAACFEKILYDERKLAHHIRFDDSVTAADSDNKNLLLYFIQSELLSDKAVEEKQNLRYFYHTFRDRLSKRDRAECEYFLTGSGLADRIRKAGYPRRLRTRITGEIALRILFLTGKI